MNVVAQAQNHSFQVSLSNVSIQAFASKHIVFQKHQQGDTTPLKQKLCPTSPEWFRTFNTTPRS